MSAPLQRLTTAYVDTEDRMRLSGEEADGRIQVLWLTQRLLGRLVPHLCAWLEQHAPQLGGSEAALVPVGGEGDLVRDLAQGFAQQAAQAQLAAAAAEPVQAQLSGWRVNGVDMQATSAAVHLVLRGDVAEQQAAMTLSSQALRQWLSIVHGQYRQAQWPLAIWPSWMSVDQVLPSGQAPGSLH